MLRCRSGSIRSYLQRPLSIPSFPAMAYRTNSARTMVEDMDADSLRIQVHELWSDLGPYKQASLCQALEEDMALSRLLWRVLSPKNEAQGDGIKRFLDLVNSPFGDDEQLFRKAYRLLLGLFQACDIMPSSMFIHGVKPLEDNAVFNGGYADIFKASKDDQILALKRPRAYIGYDGQELQQASNREALIWQGLSHPNILPFLGIDCQTFPSSPCIVSPWMRRSTVLEYLQENGPSVTERDRLLFEAAQGVAYLHRQNVVHGNLNGTNILVDQDSHVRLAGFSLARFSDAEDYDFELAAWTRNPASEDASNIDRKCGVEAQDLTPASDVYAFACVCLEVYANQRLSVGNIHGPDRTHLFHGQQPSRPADHGIQMSDDLWRLIQSCWHPNPSSRPTMGKILEQMQEIGFRAL